MYVQSNNTVSNNNKYKKHTKEFTFFANTTNPKKKSEKVIREKVPIGVEKVKTLKKYQSNNSIQASSTKAFQQDICSFFLFFFSARHPKPIQFNLFSKPH